MLRSPYAFIPIMVLILFILTGISFWFQMHSAPAGEWMRGTFAGQVVSINANILRVVDGRGYEREFTITPETFFVQGRKMVTLNNVSTSMYVVVGSREVPGALVPAIRVRIISVNALPSFSINVWSS